MNKTPDLAPQEVTVRNAKPKTRFMTRTRSRSSVSYAHGEQHVACNAELTRDRPCPPLAFPACTAPSSVPSLLTSSRIAPLAPPERQRRAALRHVLRIDSARMCLTGCYATMIVSSLCRCAVVASVLRTGSGGS
ncbi:hypothetical protein B0H11DRAFT_2266210 [Mycena galericulata]|nr:hypothetical protein B0H11DRAFT_2266210 [Mycena galericulata]